MSNGIQRELLLTYKGQFNIQLGLIYRQEHVNLSFYYFMPRKAYIRHFIFAGCYDNSPWYLVTNLPGHLDLVGHLDLAGFYFSKCPAYSKCPAKSVSRYQVLDCIVILWWRKPKLKYNLFPWAWTPAPPDRKLTLYQWAMDAILILYFRFYLTTRPHSCCGGFFSIVLAHFLQRESPS